MIRNRKLAVALTAAAVAAALSMPAHAAFFNDGEDQIEVLQQRVLDLSQSATNIQARAAAEKRDLTADEMEELGKINASFEHAELQIERLQQVAAMAARTAAPQPPRTQPSGQPQARSEEDDPPSNQARTQPRPRASVPAQPRAADVGKWGFRNEAEYLRAVMGASAKGGQVDPRLIANAPTTYGQEGVGADGGFAVPPDFRTNIITKVMGEDSLLSRTDQMTTSSNSITVPADQTTPWQATGGIQAYWESEGGQKTQSKPALTELTVKANKIVALVPLTDELLQDAPAMATYVNRKAPEKIDYKVNEAIIKGSGVGQPLGILNSAGTVEVAGESGQAPDTVVWQNINNLWYRLASASRSRAVWLMNADAEAQLPYMKFIDQGSGSAYPVYLPPGGVQNSPFSMLYGRPIITSEAMPALGDAGDIILADMSQYMTVVKAGGIRQDVSIHLWFDYDITAFRFVLRIGGQPWWNSAIERLNGQTSRGFFLKLGARA
jgi:HK97 family phage major capsid protein